MRTEQLIADLAARATVVTPLPAPSLRFVRWSAAAIASAAAGVAVFGLRSGIPQHLADPVFAMTAAIAVATAAAAALASLVLAVPGAERTPARRQFTFALLIAWTFLAFFAVDRAGHGLAGAADWPVCFVRVLLIGAVPAWLLFGMLRRALPLRRAPASALAALAATAIGSAAIQFICPLDAPAHALLGHFAPALAMCGGAAWAAPRLLKASRQI